MNGIIKSLLSSLLVAFSMFQLSAQSWPGGVHDPSSIVKDGDTYWVFGTGDGIFSMYSKDLITWQPGPTPFHTSKYDSNGTTIVTSTNYPSWISNYVHGAEDTQGNPVFHGGFWAPDIIYMNDKYYLYYSCSEWGTMTSTIGCVTNKTLDPSSPDYKWEDVGFLGIWSYQPGLALNAIDASIIKGHDGKVWMVYGSFNEEGIVITELDSITGKPKTHPGNLPGRSIANSWTGGNSYGEGEGGAMVYRDGYYYLFYNKGGCCAGIASTYYIVMGRSKYPTGPFVDKDGVPMRRIGAPSGGTVVMRHDDSRGQDDRYYGPGHFEMYHENGVDYVSFHYYDPNGFYPNPDVNNQGGPTFGLAKLDWGEDGWPSISLDFLDQGVYTLENLNGGKVADAESHEAIDGNALYQYTSDTLYDSQKWIFTPLGTGEYTITNYADPEVYVEAGGPDNSRTLALTTNYEGKINQKFRAVSSPLGYTLFYPSTKEAFWSLSLPTTGNTSLALRPKGNQNTQRWIPYRFEETLETLTEYEVDYSAATYNDIMVKSNTYWSADVFNKSWMNVETDGIKTDTLTLIVKENTRTTDRKTRIYLRTFGGLTEVITVTQKGKPTSVENASASSLINVYPNPAQDKIWIETAKQAIVTIYNQTGQTINSFTHLAGEHPVNISNWNKGVYIVKVTMENKTVVEKIVKK